MPSVRWPAARWRTSRCWPVFDAGGAGGMQCLLRHGLNVQGCAESVLEMCLEARFGASFLRLDLIKMIFLSEG